MSIHAAHEFAGAFLFFATILAVCFLIGLLLGCKLWRRLALRHADAIDELEAKRRQLDWLRIEIKRLGPNAKNAKPSTFEVVHENSKYPPIKSNGARTAPPAHAPTTHASTTDNATTQSVDAIEAGNRFSQPSQQSSTATLSPPHLSDENRLANATTTESIDHDRSLYVAPAIGPPTDWSKLDGFNQAMGTELNRYGITNLLQLAKLSPEDRNQLQSTFTDLGLRLDWQDLPKWRTQAVANTRSQDSTRLGSTHSNPIPAGSSSFQLQWEDDDGQESGEFSQTFVYQSPVVDTTKSQFGDTDNDTIPLDDTESDTEPGIELSETPDDSQTSIPNADTLPDFREELDDRLPFDSLEFDESVKSETSELKKESEDTSEIDALCLLDEIEKIKSDNAAETFEGEEPSTSFLAPPQSLDASSDAKSVDQLTNETISIDELTVSDAQAESSVVVEPIAELSGATAVQPQTAVQLDTTVQTENSDQTKEMPVFASNVPDFRDRMTLLEGIETSQADELHRMGIHSFAQLFSLSDYDRIRLQNWFRHRGWQIDLDRWRNATEYQISEPRTEEIGDKAFENYQLRSWNNLDGSSQTDWDQAAWELSGKPLFNHGVPDRIDDFSAANDGITPAVRDDLYCMGIYNHQQLEELDHESRLLLMRWFASPPHAIDITRPLGWLGTLKSVPKHRNFGQIYTHRPERTDPLTGINGIGPSIECDLNQIGIYRFSQIADWSKANIEAIAETLAINDARICERWRLQAVELGDR